MAHYPAPNVAPFDMAREHTSWLFDLAGRQFPIIARSRRRVTIARGAGRVRLRRRHLERTGQATAADGTTYRVTTYALTDERDTTP